MKFIFDFPKKRFEGKVIHRFLTLLLISMITIGSGLISASAESAPATGASLSNFQKIHIYSQGQFADVLASDWFSQNVQTVYEYSIMNGVNNSKFSPSLDITIGEIAAISARLKSIYNNDAYLFTNTDGDIWYMPYVDYLVNQGVIKSTDFAGKYGAKATRQDLAYIISNTLPKQEYIEINDINSLPDVNSNNIYFANIILLYNSGILTGSDKFGSFYPNNNISRAEVSAITSRLFLTNLRKNVNIESVMTSETVVIKKCEYTWDYPDKKYKWTYTLDIPKDTYDFYQDLPHSGKSYSYYATQATDDQYIKSLANAFNNASKEKSFDKLSEINFVISFVQSFEYVTDIAGSGSEEYPKYPIETLYDGNGDCEDTSFLLADILKELGYDVALIVFDDHMGVGISTDLVSSGSYFDYNGTKYFYIETTGTGWKIGEIPDDSKSKTAIVLQI